VIFPREVCLSIHTGMHRLTLLALLPAFLPLAPLAAHGTPVQGDVQAPAVAGLEPAEDQPEGRGPCGRRAVVILGAAGAGALAVGAAYLSGVGPALAAYLMGAPAAAPAAGTVAVVAPGAGAFAARGQLAEPVAQVAQAALPVLAGQALAEALAEPEVPAVRFAAADLPVDAPAGFDETLYRGILFHQFQVYDRMVGYRSGALKPPLTPGDDVAKRIGQLHAAMFRELKGDNFAEPITWDTIWDLHGRIRHLHYQFRLENLDGNPFPPAETRRLRDGLAWVEATLRHLERHGTAS